VLEGTFQIIQPIHLIHKRQFHRMTGLPMLPVVRDLRALCMLISREIGNNPTNRIIIGNTYRPIIAPFRCAGRDGL
jgi:hypothetical protein